VGVDIGVPFYASKTPEEDGSFRAGHSSLHYRSVLVVRGDGVYVVAVHICRDTPACLVFLVGAIR
jgi:hypothetical protein